MAEIRVNLHSVLKNELIEYPTPISLNYLWGFGSLAGIFLVIQIITGVFLAMHYCPQVDYAFYSVERIMRDIDFGWFFRYLHANGASFFFLVVYIHIMRGLYYASYFPPKQVVWISGMLIYVLMMATAFLGYVLPWGQMSFWAATVITNIVTSLSFWDGGEAFSIWLWGGFSVDNPTLNRFFSLHYLLPFVIAALALVHIILLHERGSTDPCVHGFKNDYIRFYPYFYLKDLFGLFCILFVYLFFVFYFPNYLGHPDNYVEANPLVTPKHIVPEWYFLPFYGLLRSIPNKYLGIIFMIISIVFLLLLPFVTKPIFPVNSNSIGTFLGFWTQRYTILYRKLTVFFFVNFYILGWLGSQPVEDIYIILGICSTIFYLSYFFLVKFLINEDKEFFCDRIPLLKMEDGLWKGRFTLKRWLY